MGKGEVADLSIQYTILESIATDSKSSLEIMQAHVNNMAEETNQKEFEAANAVNKKTYERRFLFFRRCRVTNDGDMARQKADKFKEYRDHANEQLAKNQDKATQAAELQAE